MQVDETGENQVAITEVSFWKRQFYAEETKFQKGFDWTFGVVLPLVCMMADPVVFKGHGFVHGTPELGWAKPFAYLLSFVSIVVMTGWLILRKRLNWMSAPIAGLFIAGSAISLVVGVILLPISLLGMVLLVGFLGFTPLFSAFVYLRNGFRAYRYAGAFLEKRVLLGTVILSAAFSLTIPYVINVEINRYVNEMITGDVATIYSHAERIKYVAPLVDFHMLGGKYCSYPNAPEHQALAEVYQRFTGESIEWVDLPVCEDW